MSIVENGKVVIMHYTLKNEAGEVLDSSVGSDPMPYLHGAANIVEGLENALTGVPVGETREVIVSPEEGYGLREGPGAQEVPRSQFPEDVELTPGMGFHAQGEDDEMMLVYIDRVDENSVWIDGNHPLAGEVLHFSVEIIGVRNPSDEELAHGHPHGIDGSVSH